MGILSDFRNAHPDYAYEISTGLESVPFLGTPGTSTATTPTTTNSREIATSVGVDLNEAPVNLDTTRTPQLTDDQMRKAFSVIPNYYWQLNCWTCRECGHSPHVYVPDANAEKANLVRVLVLSRPVPYEPLDGNVPSRKDATANRPCTKTTNTKNSETCD